MSSIPQLLVQNQIVRVNFEDPFTWTSGIRSPIYCDCRELIGLPQAREQINNGFLRIIREKNLDIDVVAGTATAGIPWAAFVAEKMEKPMLYVRSKPKGHGAGKMVEGKTEILHPNVLVVEDAISTAGSSIVSVKALRNELNATVKNILAIFTWSTPVSVKNAEEADVNIFTLTNFDEIAAALLEEGVITEDQKVELERFHTNPADWWKS